MKEGIFITMEGPEGGGKSSCVSFIDGWFSAFGKEVVRTREPGGTPLAEKIRELLLAPSDEDMCPDAELLLAFASRAQHVDKVVKPALQAGKIVVCDRFVDSSYAYQGAGRGFPVADIRTLEKLTLRGLKPDLTLILDLPIEVGMLRAVARAKLDRFESETVAFFERIRQSFLDRAKKDKERYVIIDAAGSLENTKAQIGAVLERKFLNDR